MSPENATLLAPGLTGARFFKLTSYRAMGKSVSVSCNLEYTTKIIALKGFDI
jgi:hypothetical protein